MEANQVTLNQDETERLNQLINRLDEAKVPYKILSHAETFKSAEDGVKNGMGNLAEMAPTLILETEKGFVAAIISGESRLAYKKIKKALGLKNVSLARPDVVLRETGSEVGTISMINREFPTIVDFQLTEMDTVYGGCGVPRHTLCIAPSDLIHITGAKVFDFTEAKQDGGVFRRADDAHGPGRGSASPFRLGA